jgi:thioesterase domain-containing protein
MTIDINDDELTDRIRYIWSDVLGLSSASLDDGFFSQGGNSFAMVRMLGQVYDTFGVRVDAAAIFANPTIAAVASALRAAASPAGDTGPGRPSLLHELNADATGPILVGVHGGFGTANAYYPLARRLRQVPVTAVEAVGLTDGRPPQQRFEDMAQEYVDQLLARYGTERDFVLSGYCTGGLIALEMVRGLTRRGGRITGLVLLNTGAPEPGDDGGDPVELMFWISRNIPELDLAMARRAMAISEAAVRAQDDYQVPPCELPVAFIQPAREHSGQPADEAQQFVERQFDGMRPFLQGPLHRRVLDLGPSRLIQEPWVELTAVEVAALLPALTVPEG